MNQEDIHKKEYKLLTKAKIRWMGMKDTCFYTTVLFSLKQIITDSVPTACTDGKHLYISASFFKALSTEERVGLLAHETLHVCLQHMTRLGSKDPERFNIAADHVINLMLLAQRYKLPAGALCDSKYKDMSTEEVYAALPENPKAPADGMDVIYAKGSPDDIAAIEADVTDIVLRAATQAKMANSTPGSIPGEVKIELEKKLNPQLPWNIILQNYMSQFAHNDYSWSRPNKRYAPDFYLPSLHSEAICNIAAAFDISGSTTDEMVSSYATELTRIQSDLNPEILTVLGFDTEIKSEQKFTQDSNILQELRFTGRGGTDLKEVFAWIEKHKPEVMLIFTDGEFYTPPKPKSPTNIIWIISDDVKWRCSFGKVIHYKTNN